MTDERPGRQFDSQLAPSAEPPVAPEAGSPVAPEAGPPGAQAPLAGPPMGPLIGLSRRAAGDVSSDPCRVCGHMPAAPVSFSDNRGLVVWLVSKTYHGPFCRDCGTATFRTATGMTLLLGWFGPIACIATPFFLLGNYFKYRKVRRLAAPRPVPGQPYWPGKMPAPLNPGRSVFLRWQVLGLLIPVVVLIGFTAAVVYDVQHPEGVGSCAEVEKGLVIKVRVVSCDDSHNATVVKVVEDKAACPSTAEWYVDKGYEVWCLQPE